MARDSDTITTDGRVLRRTRNREHVLDAVIEIFEEGNIDPSMDSIAARAGVSNRSIYRYFDDRDHLIRASVHHVMLRVAPELTFDEIGSGSFEERVETFVDHRLRLYHRLAPITRAAQVAAVSEPIVKEEFEASRLMLRAAFMEHFNDELHPMNAGQRAQAVIATEVVFHFDAFEFLAASTGGRIDEMRRILVDHLHLHLGRYRVARAG